jgi:hypothetical protein
MAQGAALRSVLRALFAVPAGTHRPHPHPLIASGHWAPRAVTGHTGCRFSTG